MGGESFVINVHMTGVPQTEAGAAKVSAANREMGASAKEAGAQSAAASRTVSQRWTAAGGVMSSAGKKLTRNVTLPIVAVGAAAVKMSLDFGRSMEEVHTQAGATQHEVDSMKKKLEELGARGRFSQGPKELAESLFDIESVGIRGARALQAVKSASDLATVGNADLESTTSALVGVLKTGIKGAGDMRQAIGTLNATIGAGKMHMADLNAAIGTGFIGSAKGLGLSLHGVGAALAELTSQGVPANSAATRLRMTFSLLANPTEKAAGILEGIGIGSEDLAKKMRHSGGVITALEELQEHMKGLSEVQQSQLLAGAFGGSKSGGTIVQLMEGLDDMSVKQREIIKNAGDFNKLNEETNANPEVKLQKAWSALRFELVKLGDVLIPAVVPALEKLGGVVSGLVGAFTAMPAPMQSTVLEFLALAAVAGPILKLGGAFAKMGAQVMEGMATLKGAAIVGDLQAAIALGMEGEAGAFAMLGAEAGTAIMGGLVTGLGVAAGGFAIANLLTSALSGDFKDAGFELGGSLIGGVAGFMVGGPVGAAIGAGLGSVGGELVAGLFSDGTAEKTMREKLEEATKDATAGHKHLVRSSGMVHTAEKRLARTSERQSDVLDQTRAAQKRLNAARDAGDLPKVRREEAHLNELKAKQIHLTHQQWSQETLLHAAKVKNEEDARRARTVETSLVRIRETALEEAKKHERVTRKAFEAAVLQNKPLKEQSEREQDLVSAQKRRKGAAEKLHGAEKELGATMKEITDKFGKKFADQLRNQIPLWGQSASGMKKAEHFLHQMDPAYQTLNQAIGAYKEHQENANTQTGKGNTALHKLGGAAEGAGEKVQHARTEVVGGFSGMEAKSGSFLQDLNEPNPFAAPAHASGGLMEVQGRGNRDTVPLSHQQVAAMVAPGELLAVINRHQAPLMARALHNEYGVDGLADFFSSYDRPHHMAIGGLVEPKVRAGGVFKKGMQKDLHLGFKAAVHYLQTHDKYGRVVRNGNRMDALHQPYLWGGGHGPSASPNGPWDCSGGISELLDGGGIPTTPMVSGGFMSWGQPGPGKISVLANPDHVYGVLDTKGAIGTSDSNPGGGFGWISEYRFRPGFTVRHADLGEGSRPRGAARGGRGQAPVKGFGGGGIVYLSAGGPVPPKGGELVGASYYGGSTDTVSNPTYGAWGPSHPFAGHFSFAELAMGHALGGLPFGTKLKVSRGGRSVIAEKFDIGGGGGDVAGKNRAIDLHFETAAKVGIGPSNGLAVVRVEPAGASAAGATGPGKTEPHKQAEIAFHGGATSRGGGTYAPARGKVPIEKLNFGSVPNDLHGVRKELGERRAQLAQYRNAYRINHNAQDRAAIAQIIGQLVNRIHVLLKAQAKLVQKRHQKRVTERIGKRGTFPDLEAALAADEGVYNKAVEYAGQVTDLEPTELDGAYAKIEQAAFESELESERVWRNHLVGAGQTAATRLGALEHEVARIEKLKESDPQAYRRQKYRLKPLREAITGVQGKQHDFAESLGTVQGLSGPPGMAASLPATPEAGAYGGYIFETQKAIRDLGIRLSDAVSGSNAAVKELELEVEKERVRTLSRELAIERAQRPVLSDFHKADQPGLGSYLGAYEKGGILPATGYYLGHKGEQVVPADQVGATMVHVLEPHIHVSDELRPYIHATVDRRLIKVARAAALGMSSPSAPGRRAVMRQGRSARP